jgi:hypothetical protein
MAPIVYPPKGRQTFLIKGEGSFSLTEEQRKARSLVITAEKVKTGFVYDYYNFSTPEPNTHWGYLQLMARDFVIETQQLEYRRQVVKFWDNVNLDPIEQLRCLVRKTAKFMFDLGIELSPVEQPENVQEFVLLELFEADINHPRIIPENLLTSVWYKVDIGRSVFVTIDWQGYALNNCEYTGPQVAPPAAPPKKEESGPNGGGGGGGGGGARPTTPPPSNQNGDPESDSPGPTGGADVPPSPNEEPPFFPPPRGIYRVTTRIQGFLGSTAPCVEGEVFTNEDVVNPGPALLEKRPGREGGYAWGLYDADANFIRNISGSSQRADCETIVTIVSQVRLDV